MKKEFRVKKSAEIEEIIKFKDVIGSKHFVLYKKENHENNHYRFALSVPKKYGHAVERNQIKRRIRSIVREEKIVNNVDLFVVVKITASNLSFEEIKEELLDLFQKAQILED